MEETQQNHILLPILLLLTHLTHTAHPTILLPLIS